MAQNISEGFVRPISGPMDFSSIRAGCMVRKMPTNSTATSSMAPQVKWFCRRRLSSVVLKDSQAARRMMTISITAGHPSVTSPMR